MPARISTKAKIQLGKQLEKDTNMPKPLTRTQIKEMERDLLDKPEFTRELKFANTVDEYAEGPEHNAYYALFNFLEIIGTVLTDEQMESVYLKLEARRILKMEGKPHGVKDLE